MRLMEGSLLARNSSYAQLTSDFLMDVQTSKVPSNTSSFCLTTIFSPGPVCFSSSSFEYCFFRLLYLVKYVQAVNNHLFFSFSERVVCCFRYVVKRVFTSLFSWVSSNLGTPAVVVCCLDLSSATS